MQLAIIYDHNNDNKIDSKKFISKLSEQHAFLNAKEWILTELSQGKDLEPYEEIFTHNQRDNIYQILDKRGGDLCGGFYGQIIEI